MSSGGIRAFLRRGKFAPQHSELDSFLSGRISREEGLAHIRQAVAPSARGGKRLRTETLRDLHAWDVVYLDRLATGRLLPGEKTAAAEPLQGLNPNEALLIQQVETHKAASRRLVDQLPKIVQKSLQARIRRIDQAWQKDEQLYSRLFPEPVAKKKPVTSKKPAAKAKSAASAARAKASRKKKPWSRRDAGAPYAKTTRAKARRKKRASRPRKTAARSRGR
jgi:hypothetical protein